MIRFYEYIMIYRLSKKKIDQNSYKYYKKNFKTYKIRNNTHIKKNL